MCKTIYYLLEGLVARIEGSNGEACRRILHDHRALFQSAPGSSHNHQAWTGGYWDHVSEVMNLAVLLYETLEGTGRLAQLPPGEQFSLSDVLLVLFIHDLEKPWRTAIGGDGQPLWENGKLVIRPELKDKAARKAFVAAKLAEYGIELTEAQAKGLKYVEGIRDEDYTPDDRIMNPLAALCHACDLLSARCFYDFPLAGGDGWLGASRRAAHRAPASS